jgi:hypothetical protein
MAEIELDPELVEFYTGRTLLVGVNYYDADDKLLHQRQFHGVILRINLREGLVLGLASGDGSHSVAAFPR